jgi:phage tail protein X
MVSVLLGHSYIQTTLDLYVYQNYDTLKTVIDMLSNANKGVNSYKMAKTTKIHGKHMV